VLRRLPQPFWRVSNQGSTSTWCCLRLTRCPSWNGTRKRFGWRNRSGQPFACAWPPWSRTTMRRSAASTLAATLGQAAPRERWRFAADLLFLMPYPQVRSVFFPPDLPLPPVELAGGAGQQGRAACLPCVCPVRGCLGTPWSMPWSGPCGARGDRIGTRCRRSRSGLPAGSVASGQTVPQTGISPWLADEGRAPCRRDAHRRHLAFGRDHFRMSRPKSRNPVSDPRSCQALVTRQITSPTSSAISSDFLSGPMVTPTGRP
jgi:hypothetical protein